ncbi:ATP synthase subunit O, mitochondrial-like [Pectinophora gossypiella]|uniref:ATP synthase subunit O, mitochondrial-like n=1 Tax=Pectinophora gossypiella TaxID=13191 RepID=UPI00214DFB0C|nr:ATP synthase subunit O, mitochondrial-like [Pectinophora gossypiella]
MLLHTFAKRMYCSGTSLKVKPPLHVFGIEGRYVSALYSAGHTLKQLEKVEESLRVLSVEIIKPRVVDFIETSMISRNEKAAMLKSFGTSAGLPSAATNFLEIVAENGRLKKLRRMITLFLAVMVAHRNEALCEVITANPLDNETRAALVEALKKLAKGKNITLTERVDPSIIGGVIVGVEDKHVDMSIARKIQMYTDILKESI